MVSRAKWAIPVLVDEYEADGKPVACRILPALTLTDEQHRTLGETLNGLQHLRTSEGWLLTWNTLRTVAKRAQGITVARYLRWKDVPAHDPSTGDVSADPTPGPSDFITYIHQRFHPAPLEMMQVVWMAVCQALPSYLMSGGVVDLGSVRLGAVPLRRSWVKLLLGRAQWIRHLYRAPDWQDRWRYEAERVVRALTAGDMMATFMRLAGGRLRVLHRWTCCVVHDQSWDECVQDVEVDQMKRLGAVDYVKRWARLVAVGLPIVHQVLREEARNETLPGGRIRPGRDGGDMELGQTPPTEVRDGEVVEFDRDGRASPFDAWSVDARFAYVETANASLLQVPTVPRPIADVRKAGGDGGPIDNAGVLVPPSDGIPDQDEGVLAGGGGP